MLVGFEIKLTQQVANASADFSQPFESIKFGG